MPRKFYIPVTNLLQADKSMWQGMRRVGELRRELKAPVPNKPDSEYKPIVRTERKFAPLVIPKALQASLPFASKVQTFGPGCGNGVWVGLTSLVRAQNVGIADRTAQARQSPEESDVFDEARSRSGSAGKKGMPRFAWENGRGALADA